METKALGPLTRTHSWAVGLKWQATDVPFHRQEDAGFKVVSRSVRTAVVSHWPQLDRSGVVIVKYGIQNSPRG
jgi:hypothetical protein